MSRVTMPFTATDAWLSKIVEGHTMRWHLTRCDADVGGEGRPWKPCNRHAVEAKRYAHGEAKRCAKHAHQLAALAAAEGAGQ